MYPTPPATASSSSVDGDTFEDSAYHEDHPMIENDGKTPFPRISKPIEHIRDSYDCVVIGSGYGGSIAASRMARAGKSVCLLERGEERWPGEYPTGTIDTMKQYRVTGDLIPSSFGGVGVNIGNPTGMFHLILGHDQNVIAGNGKYQPPTAILKVYLAISLLTLHHLSQAWVAEAWSTRMYFSKQKKTSSKWAIGHQKFETTRRT